MASSPDGDLEESFMQLLEKWVAVLEYAFWSYDLREQVPNWETMNLFARLRTMAWRTRPVIALMTFWSPIQMERLTDSERELVRLLATAWLTGVHPYVVGDENLSRIDLSTGLPKEGGEELEAELHQYARPIAKLAGVEPAEVMKALRKNLLPLFQVFACMTKSSFI